MDLNLKHQNHAEKIGCELKQLIKFASITSPSIYSSPL